MMQPEQTQPQQPPHLKQLANFAWPQQQLQMLEQMQQDGKEKRKCYNCGQVGHLGKDCPLPDKRKNKDAGGGGNANIPAQVPPGIALDPAALAQQAQLWGKAHVAQ